MKTFLDRLLPKLVLTTLVLATACQPVAGQTPTRAGSWPGYNRRSLSAVAVSGKYAYAAGSHGGMQIIDISNLAAPAPVGGYNPNGDLPYPNATADNVAVSGDYAYVVFGALSGAGRRGLHVVDVSNPHQPIGKGKVFTSNACVDVAVAGGFAFVAAEATGLLIANVSNPASPVSAGSYNTSGTARGVAVAGQFAYVADGAAGLQVIDVSNPAAPVRVGGYNTPGEAYDVAIAGTYAYVADGVAGLQVIDVSNPAAPVRLGDYNTPGEAYGVAVSGSVAYVADGATGLQVIDVSNPAAPARVGGIGTPAQLEPPWYSGFKAGNVAVSGNHVFVAHREGDAGIDIIDVTDPAAPRREGYHGVAYASSVAAAGNHLYVADRHWMHVFDLTNPAAPRRIGGVVESAADVTLALGHAYVIPTYPQTGFSVIDLNDPARPEFVGRYGEGTEFRRITVHGRHAYAGFSEGLQIFDLTNPAEPTLAGAYNTAGGAAGVAFSGHHAFVGGASGLRVIDVSNPAAPTQVGELNIGTWDGDVTLVGPHHVYLSEWNALNIVDVSDPASPRSVRRLTFNPSDTRLVGNFLLFADGDRGLRVLDVSNPAMPVIKWTVSVPNGNGLAVWGEYAYLANGYGGVALARIPALAAPRLGIERAGGGVRLSWPLSASAWMLEAGESLQSPGPWSPVPPPYSEDGTSRFLTIPTEGNHRFFRLVRP